MSTRLQERIFSPLAAKEARALVDEVNALIDALASADAEDDVPDPGIDGFQVVPERGERDENGYAALDVFDDVSLELDDARPPTAAEVRAIARASGHAASSFVFEPAALARLPGCHSSLTLAYDTRIYDTRPFVALQKLVFARVGAAVVSLGEGTKVTTLETAVAQRTKELGLPWADIPPLGRREPPTKKVRKTRPAKAGELEALAVHQRLAGIIEGHDPLARDLLEKALQRTTDAVRSYAATLLEDGPRPDAAVAKAVRCPVAQVVESRKHLRALLDTLE